MTCPPCTHDCNQGETCPAKDRKLTQRTWVGLTDEERVDLWKATETDNRMILIDAIEAKLKQNNGFAEEKNT
jgi:hypothetical protein